VVASAASVSAPIIAPEFVIDVIRKQEADGEEDVCATLEVPILSSDIKFVSITRMYEILSSMLHLFEYI